MELTDYAGAPLSESQKRKVKTQFAAEIEEAFQEAEAERNDIDQRLADFHRRSLAPTTASDWEPHLTVRSYAAEPFETKRPEAKPTGRSSIDLSVGFDSRVQFLAAFIAMVSGGLFLTGQIQEKGYNHPELGMTLTVVSLATAFLGGIWVLHEAELRARRATSEKDVAAHHLAMAAWSRERRAYEKVQEQGKADFDQAEQERINQLRGVLCGDVSTMEFYLEGVLGEVRFPLETMANFTVSSAKGVVLDVDLPEVEMVPREQTVRTSNGGLSVKKKTETKIRGDYAIAVHGLTIWLASLVFHLLPTVEVVTVSGYTQRANLKTGNLSDDYILSVAFTRDVFSKLSPANSDPCQFVENFRYRREMSKTHIFKAIQPLQDEAQVG